MVVAARCARGVRGLLVSTRLAAGMVAAASTNVHLCGGRLRALELSTSRGNEEGCNWPSDGSRRNVRCASGHTMGAALLSDCAVKWLDEIEAR